MKVSVASTSFNQKASLQKLYDSLLINKDYLDLWVVWEDNSIDGSIEMLKEWEKKGEIPMKVNYNKEKTGMGIRHNWILKYCNDLSILVFGDSYLEADTLKKLSESYVEGTAGSGYRIDVDIEGNWIRNDHRFEPDEKVYSVMQHRFPWQSVCGNSFIVRRKDLEKIGWFDEEYNGYGYDDYDWFMRLMMNGVKLYAYNNIKIYHVDHPAKPGNPDSFKRYTDKLKGNGYDCKAKTVTLDLDDFSIEVNNLYYLDLLKQTYPQLKVSLFYIPFDVHHYGNLLDFQRKEVVQMILDRKEWIELIPHGLTHTPEEFLHIKNDDYDTVFKAIEDGFKTYGLPMVKGFKAPQWLYNPNMVEFLDANGWWMAVDRNQPEAPRTKKYFEYTHSIDEPFWLSNQETIHLHGHITGPSSNDLVTNITNIMRINPDVTFRFVSEVINEDC